MRIGYVNQGGIKTGLDGSIVYDFNGHVHAAGLDLDVDPTIAATPDHMVRWLYPDGTEGAHIDVNDPAPGGLTTIQVFAGEWGAVLLDSEGDSSYIQGLGPGGLRLHGARIGPIAVPAGWSQTIFDLVQPHHNIQLALVVSIEPFSGFAVSGVEAGPVSPSQGFFRVNVPAAQNVLVNYISIGA